MMESFPLLLLFTIVILGVFVTGELFTPKLINEGFANATAPNYWNYFVSPRSDIGPDQEDFNYIRDPRFFNDYASVQRLNSKFDFCRMLAESGDESNVFFACALAGTENLDSTKFRTASVKDGFRVSYDDYMRDINNDGRDDYCRILKWNDGTFQPVCARATDVGFDTKEIVDSDPPSNIKTLVSFYDGCVIWLRLASNLTDYVGNVKVQTRGKISIEETPRPGPYDGLQFLGGDQYIRLSDSLDLTLGKNVPLRSVRSWMTWVYFDEFTNNAKIFDFGNGPGKSNVFLGIVGKGDEEVSGKDLRPLLCGSEESTIPDEPSGAQGVKEIPPKLAMEQSEANINEYTCTGFPLSPRRLKPSTVIFPAKKPSGMATLLFEVWDQQYRKMSIKVARAIPLNKWTHICVTATNDDAQRPNIAIYINNVLRNVREGGFLPTTSTLTNCYIGKSNWYSPGENQSNRDEMFKGRLFDFRAYRKSLSEQLISDSYDWGKEMLGEK